MKKTIFMILFVSLATLGLATASHAERVTMDDAKKAAEHWITFIIAKKGSWGGAEIASLETIKEFRRKGRKIGYFAKVRPRGYIILPLRKELAPIKAYSAVSDLEPESETGMADITKGRMEATITGIEKRLGVLDRIPTKALQKILLKNHRKSWDKLIGEQGDMTFEAFSDNVVTMNYEGGEPFLLSSYWNQISPYNLHCPTPLIPPCTGPGQQGHTKAGCVAIAGAQVIRYWNWPPRRRAGVIPYAGEPYVWPSMFDKVKNTSDQASIDAVADLVAKVGDLVDMDYGCSGSGADTREMENAYDFMGYHESGGPISRWLLSAPFYTPREWFELMKEQLNQNRPLQYSIPGDPGHSVVVDGWQEDLVGVMQYHMNYGHGDTLGDTTWYTMDEDPFNGQGEYMFVNVRPATSLEGTISGTYEKQGIVLEPEVEIPYYVDQDAVGHSAVFEPGVLLQFLGDVTVTNTSTVGGTFRFEGGAFDRTLLFAEGDQTKGIKINNGAMVLSENGSIKLHKIPRPGP